VAVAASAARLRGVWCVETATTSLDGAATLECSAGEAIGRQNGRDGATVSASKRGTAVARARGEKRREEKRREEKRREERRLTSGLGQNLKYRTKTKFCSKLGPFQTKFCSKLGPFQTLASKLGKNPGKFMPTGFDVLDNFCYWSFLKFEMEFELQI
jgi:hypothetical protein